MKKTTLAEVISLFFAMRQIIRSQLPVGEKSNPNEWLRCETLSYIADHSPTMQDLATYLRVRPSSATSLVNTLARAGQIKRTPQPDDRRVVRISLSPKGRRALDGYIKEKTQAMRAVFSKLDEPEIQQLAAILRRLLEVHKK